MIFVRWAISMGMAGGLPDCSTSCSSLLLPVRHLTKEFL